jgi:hypothetical protein
MSLLSKEKLLILNPQTSLPCITSLHTGEIRQHFCIEQNPHVPYVRVSYVAEQHVVQLES